MIPFLILNVIIAFNVNRSLQSDLALDISNISSHTEYYVEDLFSEIQKVYEQLLLNTDAINLLNVNIANADFQLVAQNTKGFYSYANYVSISNSLIDSIYLYSTYNNYVFAQDSSNYITDFQDLEWYHLYLKNNKQNYIASVSKNSIDTPYDELIVCMNIYPFSKHSGVLVFQINQSKLNNLLNSYQLNNMDTFHCLLDENNTVIYSSKNQDVSANNMISQHKLKNLPITLCSFAYLSKNDQIFKKLLPIVIPYSLFTIFLIVLVAFLSSLKLYKSIITVMTSIEIATDAGYTASKSYDEINYINKSIVNTLIYNKKIEESLVFRLSELKKAQTIALQTQINPHFLFNTLNLVNTIIISNNSCDTEAVQIIDILSDLLSQALDTANYIIDVKSELEYARKYLEIELIRDNYEFDVIWDIAEDTLKLKTIKMILQPIIENAIAHGIRNISGLRRGCINIKNIRKNNDFYFIIKDNGSKMDGNILKSIRENLNSDSIVESEHIGISNVHHRIQLVYGKKYGCFVSSNCKGTIVVMHLPATS